MHVVYDIRGWITPIEAAGTAMSSLAVYIQSHTHGLVEALHGDSLRLAKQPSIKHLS